LADGPGASESKLEDVNQSSMKMSNGDNKIVPLDPNRSS